MESIYLISTSSYRLMEEEIKKVVKKNPYTIFDLGTLSLDEVLEEAAYFSLFDEKKYIVVKNANVFGASKRKKDEEEIVSKKDDALLRYLEQPNPNTIVIFSVNGKIDSKKKICKIIKERYNLIQIDDLKPKEIVSKLEKSFKEDGYKCDSNILYYITNNSLNNYDLAMNEIDKIKLYYGKGCQVKMNDVMQIVSYNMEESNFKLIDAIMNKNIKLAFNIFDDLMRQKVEPIMLISMISKDVRNTLLVKKMLNTSTKEKIKSTLGIGYDFQIDKLINNCYSFKVKELEEYLVLLCDLDYKIKRGKISNKLALEMFILNICK